ncbi:MAG: hypothetical protein ABIN39_03850 [candidate division WOR-3 bacterium]
MKKFFIVFLILYIFYQTLLSSEKFYRFLDFDPIGRIEGKEKITKSEFDKIEGYKIYYDNKKRPISIEICYKGKPVEKDIFDSNSMISKIEISYTDTFVKIENDSLFAEKMVYKFFDRKNENVKIFDLAQKIVFVTFDTNNHCCEKVISYFENEQGEKVLSIDSVLIKLSTIFKNKTSNRWEINFYSVGKDGNLFLSPDAFGFEKIIRNQNNENIVDSLKFFNREEYIVLSTEKVEDENFQGTKSLKIKKDSKGELQRFYELIFYDDIGYEFKKIYLDTLLKPFDMDSNFAVRIIKRNNNFTYDKVEYFSSDPLLKTKMPPSMKYNEYPLFKTLTKKFVYDKDYNLLGVEKIE